MNNGQSMLSHQLVFTYDITQFAYDIIHKGVGLHVVYYH